MMRELWNDEAGVVVSPEIVLVIMLGKLLVHNQSYKTSVMQTIKQRQRLPLHVHLAADTSIGRTVPMATNVSSVCTAPVVEAPKDF